MSLLKLQERARAGERLAMVTCYDASFARVLEAAGVEILLVGDSLGNVIQGQATTLPVTLADMAYHVRCVARGSRQAYIVADLPFGTFQVSPQEAYRNAAELMAAGAHMVKLEGGQIMAETVEFLASRSIPVCGHLGLVPQSVHTLGGYRVQGRTEAAARQMLADARTLEAAGAGLLVLEAIPQDLARQITESLAIPTIGIGAGASCDGQVLVLHDMLGLTEKPARFVKIYLNGQPSVEAAIAAFVADVKAGRFPGPEHCYA